MGLSFSSSAMKQSCALSCTCVGFKSTTGWPDAWNSSGQSTSSKAPTLMSLFLKLMVTSSSSIELSLMSNGQWPGTSLTFKMQGTP